MDENLPPEQINELKKQLEEVKRELEDTRQKQVIISPNQQDKFIETLFEKGGQIIVDYTKLTEETSRFTFEKNLEIQKEELIIINKLDTKEKIYKGSMIGLCIIALVLTALLVPKSEIVIPVLSLIIGLLFKSSTLADFLSHTKNKYKSSEEDD